MTQDPQNIIDESFARLMKTYSPQPVVMHRGEGAYAYDTSGKKYLDFAAGIAVAALGHAHPAMMKTITEQAATLMACQASYATLPKLEAAKLLLDNSCFDLVYFSNSGTESVEAAIKMSRKWAYENKSKEAHEVIAFEKSFHGRTMGSASLTYKRDAQPFFGPYIQESRFAKFNDIDSVKALVSEKTAAIIVEPVQGEGGLTPADPSFLRALRKLCDEEKIVLIFDEIQCGMGRLGTLFAYQSFKCCPDCVETGTENPDNHAPIEPDVVTLAKGLGSGFPVGAVVAKKQFGEAIVPGTHGTTYGGNPLACAVVATVMKELLSDGFLDHVHKVGQLFRHELKNLENHNDKVTAVRGMGLMTGFETVHDTKVLVEALRQNGLMSTMAGNSVRITPPLIVTEDQAHEALEIIERTINEL